MVFVYLSPEFPPDYAHFIQYLDDFDIHERGIDEADVSYTALSTCSSLRNLFYMLLDFQIESTRNHVDPTISQCNILSADCFGQLRSLHMFVGIGYDLHRLMPVRDLVLGGVKIPYERGLVGHSDADVLLHAVIDAILGAAAMGDIGQNFPDNDPEFKDVSSMELLAITWRMVQAKGFQLQNVDATILAEEPKMVPYKNQMRKNIADVLKLDIERVNVKAKTMEGLGAIGRREGIAVMAVAMLKMRKQDDI